MEVINDYNTTIKTLFERRPKKRSSLSIMQGLLPRLGNPHLHYPTVHIAGTNGKGQVAVKLAFALQSAGYRVGLFTSPHIIDFEERIQVNGNKIPKEKVIEYYTDIEKLFTSTDLEPNFFECITCMGFRYFREVEVDIAIIEVGLGGTFDATNVVEPCLTVITSISYDHTNYLGDSLDEIAEQKAGIIKPDTPVVVGPRAKYLPIFNRAEAVLAPINVVERKSCFYDTENQSVAKEALSILDHRFPMSKEAMEAGLNQSLPCRFDKRGSVIYDVAHNPDGFTRLANALEHVYPYRTFRFVIGVSQEKDTRGCLEQIKDKAKHIHFVEAARENTASLTDLEQAFQSIATCPYSLEKSITDGVRRAKAALVKDEILVVCGSFYIMAEAIAASAGTSALKKEEIRPAAHG